MECAFKIVAACTYILYNNNVPIYLQVMINYLLWGLLSLSYVAAKCYLAKKWMQGGIIYPYEKLKQLKN